ncbi:nucleoside hydrolase [Butyrivibrio sp. NC3005]|uniref:nucleoside hydrolase n=1 Tax=Butyrivibrio sp. NC3005 TaxID=1280685 RepID=UPI00041D6D1D|nr:nucleoside hydrolase [Butyrivibrio sp. NC3005]
MTASKMMEKKLRRVIIDTDTGGDDAAAIILAAMSNVFDIVGVTVAAGNVSLDQAAKNALMSLEIAGCSAPVYMGAHTSMDGIERETVSIFGKDGMGDAGLIHPQGKVEEQNAVDFILESVRKYPNEIEIVTLAPVTNIARAIEKDKETMKKVKCIWSMGTSGFGPGNATPVSEFNVYKDALAYKIMLDSGIPVEIIGLDACEMATVSKAQLDEMKNGNQVQNFVAASLDKIMDFYIQNNGIDFLPICDAIAMLCVFDDEFVLHKTICHGSCIADEGECFGQVIFYKKGFAYDSMPKVDSFNATVIDKVDGKRFFELYNKIVG